MKCNYPKCEETTVVKCFYPDNSSDIPNEYYCHDHTKEHGFCFGCGKFCGRVESFDFASANSGIEGLCENCFDALKKELGWDDDDDDDDEFS